MKAKTVIVVAAGVGLLAWLATRARQTPTAANDYAEPSVLDTITTAIQENIVEPVKSVVSGIRGLRNNNPGNIERTRDQWKGMSADQSSDPRFVVFDAPVWGLRALARVLRKYNAAGLLSVQAMISKWAPSTENNTSAYANAVARELGVSPTQQLVMTDDVLARLMAAIVRHENGQQPYDSGLFAQAIQLERSA